MHNNQRFRIWSWYLFDAGNSAHALLVSTVGFALYFRQYLYAENPNVDSMWGLITAFVLAVAALLSPFLTSLLYHRGRRWLGLAATTVGCVFFTILLGFEFSDRADVVVLVYALGAMGYYLALPIYTSYIRDVSDVDQLERRSSIGWAVGYLGGILVALVALSTGALTASISESPHEYRKIFVIAGLFNLVFSVPLLYWAWAHDRNEERASPNPWKASRIFDVLAKEPKINRLLFSYWMVSETGTIAIYFTAIFLGQYAGLSPKSIFMCTIAVQLLAAASTAMFGVFSSRVGGSAAFRTICLLWLAVPPLLWSVKLGLSYWFSLLTMGLVLGAHHALVRAEVARLATNGQFSKEQKGSIFGFLEVSGRVSSIIGPLVVGLSALFMQLSEALLVASLFPVIALFVIRRYQWVAAS